MYISIAIQLINIPPPDPVLHLRFRLFPNTQDRINNWEGRDVFVNWSQHRYEFWHASGETQETLGQVYRDMIDDYDDARI